MRSSDEIYQLISSMSDNEKRFFRKKYTLFVSDDDSNYINYFDGIAKQVSEGKGYDEKKIKSGSYSGKFLKNLSFHKNYLYSIILNILSLYHKDSRDKYIVRELITQAEILSEKMLFAQSMKLLLRAKKIASEKELPTSLYEILYNERTIFKYTVSVEEYSSKYEDILKEQHEIMDTQKNLLDYFLLNEKTGIFLRTFGSGKVRGKEDLLEFEKMFDNPLLYDIENARSFLSRYIFYNLNLQLHLTKQNYEKAYECALNAVRLWEDNPEKIAGKPDNYIFSLYNLMNTQVRTHRISEFVITEAKLRNLPEKFPGQITEANKVFIFYSISVMNLSAYLESIDPDKLISTETEISKELNIYEEKITVYQRIILFYFLSTSNFILENFEKCIYWNGKIFSLGKTDLSGDYQCYARIIQLIAYYELGYIDSLEYVLKSAYHFISKRKRVYKYENIIQKYLRRSFRIRNNNELEDMFGEMLHELKGIINDDFEKNAFDAFNIIPWLESKLKKIPMVRVLKEKNKII